ncbi:site-specific integrase [Hahella sp. HN01]|uniref:tyrosine-type recombinase/integrase n=1 Tax=Hahella sp. HN01 TaxID=2847262 RepID=UPI001C1EAA71|nr:site-specific integrase [Hahella sp. HN01]MBU6950924.1 site-specific integrase [Hahella sp. HN01]
MATFRKRGSAWRVEVNVKGQRDSATKDTKAEAQEWAARREIELRSQFDGRSLTHIVRDVFERYGQEVSPSKRGQDKELLRLASFCRDHIADIKLADLNASHIADWRNRRLKQVSPSSVNRELNLMSHAFEIARREWRWLTESPTRDVTRPKNPPPRDRKISDDEIERVCLSLGFVDGVTPETKSQRVAIAFLFAIESGMRAGEICGLTWDAVNGNVAYLPKTKNGTSRNVPLSSRACELLSFLPVDGESVFNITTVQLDAIFRKGRDRAGVENLTFHDTRHEAITRLAKKLDVLELARMVGHKDLKQLLVYYNETPQALAAKLG